MLATMRFLRRHALWSRAAPARHRFSLDGGGRAAGGRDLLPGRAGERVYPQLQPHVTELAGAQDLHRGTPANAAHATGREQLGQPVEVDHLVFGAKPVRKPLQLGQPHVQRHLAALEAVGDVLAGAGALGAAAGSLALGALAAPDPGLRRMRAGSRPQMVDLKRHDQSTSSNVTRCLTVAIMPRISGRSSLTTVCEIRLSPSERSVCRWFSFPPMPERICVTLRRDITPPPRPAPAAWRPAPRPRSAGHGGPRPPPVGPGRALSLIHISEPTRLG